MFKSNRIISEGPRENHIKTEDERQIQNLLQQQTSKNISFNEQLLRGREFSTSGTYDPDVKQPGTVSLEKYNEALKKVEFIENLKSCGLTDEEIELKLNQSSGKALKRKGLEHPEVTLQKLAKIDQKLKMKSKELENNSTFRNKIKLPRQRYMLERSLANTEEKAKLYDILLEQTFKEDEGGCLKATIEKVEKNIKDFITNKRKNKATSKKTAEETLENPLNVYPHNKWERIEQKLIGPTQKPEKWEEDVEFIPNESILRYKLTDTELRLIPRFKDYDPGQPNNILFLKNLSPKITEKDLHMLFNRFSENEKVECRLLQGKMKGQAFVTLSSIEEAIAALKLINGYELKGKPIVIVFGKKRGKT